MTVREVITGALRLLGIYGGNETPQDDELTDGLSALNEMVNDWNAQHLTIFFMVHRVLALAAGNGTYTIGSGGAATFDYPRPVKIEGAGIVGGNNVRSELKLDTSREWALIPEKVTQGRLPLRMYYDNNYPIASIVLWPVPVQDCSLDIYYWSALNDALTLDDTLNVPPAYGQAIRYNLAVLIAPEYGRDPGPVVLAIAQRSKQELVGLNASNFAGTQDPPPAPPTAAA